MTEGTLANLIFDAERRIGSYVISIIDQHPELLQDTYIAEQYAKIQRWSKEMEGRDTLCK